MGQIGKGEFEDFCAVQEELPVDFGNQVISKAKCKRGGDFTAPGIENQKPSDRELELILAGSALAISPSNGR